MAKLTDAQIAVLKALFETGDTPTEGNFISVFDSIQQGIEEHDHNALGDGDAAPITDLACGDRVAQFYRRQGGHATSWDDNGTTDYTPTTVRMQAGCILWSGDSATFGTLPVTFPVAFSDKPLVFLTHPGGNNVVCSSQTTLATGFTALWKDVNDTPHVVIRVSWLAIGPE